MLLTLLEYAVKHTQIHINTHMCIYAYITVCAHIYICVCVQSARVGMHGWMDGWRDGGMEGWRDGGMEGGMDGGVGLEINPRRKTPATLSQETQHIVTLVVSLITSSSP